ncbi:S-Ena type endospore appendage [Bacillus sp. SM2101]|uniref:S-Ena type endospore appendage n=1 Tax=Bacillaceae TaxID=186817 RepID=UPI001BDE69C9
MSCSCKDKKGVHKDCCFSCCSTSEFFQDQSCCNFTLTANAVQEVYVTNVLVTATGTISITAGQVATFIVMFRRGATVVDSVNVFADSCVAFTVTDFDNIQVTAPALDNPASGEICITPRYKLR